MGGTANSVAVPFGTNRTPVPAQAGIGLRFAHHRAVIESRPQIGWLEVHPENYLGGGANLRSLNAVRDSYPLSFHGVGLSLGTAQGLDRDHLRQLKELIDRIEPGLVSEHLSWSRVDGNHIPDLLPLPLTEEALACVCRNVDAVQSCFGRRILLENPSSYLRYRHSTIPEWEFLAAVAHASGCGILCDVNNIYVSACNHGWSAQDYLAALPAKAIGEIHLAGHATRLLDNGRVLRIDDHGSRVQPEVWALYEQAIAHCGVVPTLIEWDNDIPGLDVLLDEARQAETYLESARAHGYHAIAA